MKKGHRVDSNHHRTGTIPIPSDRLKVLYPLYILSAWCATTNLKAMLTDGFAFRFFSCLKRSAPYLMVHRGRLSATSPAHHRMAINHLLHRLDMMCFLALGATSYLTKYENLRSDTIPDFFIGLCCVRV